MSAATAIALPAFYHIPADLLPDLLRIMQRGTGILPAFGLPTFHVLPDFFLGVLRLFHGWANRAKNENAYNASHQRQLRKPHGMLFDAAQKLGKPRRSGKCRNDKRMRTLMACATYYCTNP